MKSNRLKLTSANTVTKDSIFISIVVTFTQNENTW